MRYSSNDACVRFPCFPALRKICVWLHVTDVVYFYSSNSMLKSLLELVKHNNCLQQLALAVREPVSVAVRAGLRAARARPRPAKRRVPRRAPRPLRTRLRTPTPTTRTSLSQCRTTRSDNSRSTSINFRVTNTTTYYNHSYSKVQHWW